MRVRLKLNKQGWSGQEDSAPQDPRPIGIENFGERSKAEECAQGQGRFCPFAGLATEGEKCQPKERGCGCSEDGEGEALHCPEKAQPRS